MPLDAWFRGPLRELFEEAVLAPRAPAADLVDRSVARQVYRAHLAGTGRHGDVLWSLLTLARWVLLDFVLGPVQIGRAHV